MKICPKCGMTNADNAPLCAECFTSLNQTESENITHCSEEFFEREEKKERRRRIIHLLLIPLYYIIFLPLAVMNVLMEFETLIVMLVLLPLPLLYYLSVFKPELLFYLNHMMSIQNIDEAEPSDWYLFNSKLGGYLMLIFGIGLTIYLYISLSTSSPGSGFTVTVG